MFDEQEIVEYQVITMPEANDDISLLSDFYFDIAGEKSAIRFEIAAETIISSLGTWPRCNAMWEDDETIRRVNMPNHKVSIIYRIDDKFLKVIAVAAFHTLRNPKKTESLINSRLK